MVDQVDASIMSLIRAHSVVSSIGFEYIVFIRQKRIFRSFVRSEKCQMSNRGRERKRTNERSRDNGEYTYYLLIFFLLCLKSSQCTYILHVFFDRFLFITMLLLSFTTAPVTSTRSERKTTALLYDESL